MKAVIKNLNQNNKRLEKTLNKDLTEVTVMKNK